MEAIVKASDKEVDNNINDMLDVGYDNLQKSCVSRSLWKHYQELRRHKQHIQQQRNYKQNKKKKTNTGQRKHT